MQEHPIGGGMGMTAENLAEQYGIPREEQDLFALRSQQIAGRAIREGRFKDEISPVPIPQRKGEPKMFDTDEHPKPDMTWKSWRRFRLHSRKAGRLPRATPAASTMRRLPSS